MSAGRTIQPVRPVLRWHGGKWKLAPWILQHFPPHRTYVEPYGGAASVLLRKPPVFAEIYNDLDEDVVNLFEVLRDRVRSAALLEQLRLTPFARREFDRSYELADDPVERARRLIIRSYMGYGSDSAHTSGNTGFRAQSPKSNRSPEKDWANYADALGNAIERLREIVIECRPALRVMARHDAADTLHYVDPPYLPETRSAKSRKGGEKYHVYRHEMSAADHRALLKFVRGLKGYVVLSGYRSELYQRALKGWRYSETETHADGGRPRIEALWINPTCAAALDRAQLPLLMVGGAAA